MSRAGIWVNCEVLENADFDLIVYSVDENIIMRENETAPNADLTVNLDYILPTIKKKLLKVALNKQGILIHDKKLKAEQEE